MRLTFLYLSIAILILRASAFKIKNPESRIVNGNLAKDTDFPYHVGIHIDEGDGNINRCGGALISENHVLTAAHCFKWSDNGTAYFGSNKFREGIPINFTKTTVHGWYNPHNKLNDIAIVHLEKPIKPNGSTIKIINLDDIPLVDDEELIVSGFGLIGDNDNDNIDLRYIPIKTISDDICRKYHPIRDSNLCCQGTEGRSPCRGDSGSPLVRNWPENPTHVGFVSAGSWSCEEGRPVVFTKTASHLDWIRSKTKN